jgi:hypothetical protein
LSIRVPVCIIIGCANLDDILWKKRRWNGSEAYAESKLHDAMLAFAIARRWLNVLSNPLEPGWVPTKMGGPGAPDDMKQARLTQAWLAASDDAKANVTGKYFYHLKRMDPNPQANDPALQDRLIAMCAEISGDNKTLSTVTHFSFRSKLSHSIEPRSPLLAGLPKWAARLHKNLL